MKFGKPGILTVIAVLFLIVFGIKRGDFPTLFLDAGFLLCTSSTGNGSFRCIINKSRCLFHSERIPYSFIMIAGYTYQILMVLSILTIILESLGRSPIGTLKRLSYTTLLLQLASFYLAFGNN